MAQRALYICLAALAVLVAMLAVSVTTGATQEAYEYGVRPAELQAALLAHPGATRLLFALDTGFLVLYTLLFTAIYEVIAARGGSRAFLRLALIAVYVAAALDVVENYNILALLDLAQHGSVPTDGQMEFESALSGTKYALATLGMSAFGVCLPRDGAIAWILAGFLTIGTIAITIANTALPPDMRPDADLNRWFGFLIGFGIAGLWLRGQCKPEGARAALTE